MTSHPAGVLMMLSTLATGGALDEQQIDVIVCTNGYPLLNCARDAGVNA